MAVATGLCLAGVAFIVVSVFVSYCRQTHGFGPAVGAGMGSLLFLCGLMVDGLAKRRVN